MADEQRPTTNISEELNKLGAQVAEAIRVAWESDERKKLQGEIVEGAQRFGHQLEEAVRQAKESEAAQRVKTQAEQVASKARETDVVEDVREGLLNGLQTLNRELGKLLARMEEGKAGTAAAPEQPAPTNSVTTEPSTTLEPPDSSDGPTVQI
jgi:hypothetical protein